MLVKFRRSAIAALILVSFSVTYESSSLLASLSLIAVVSLSVSSVILLILVLIRSLATSFNPPSDRASIRLSICFSLEASCFFILLISSPLFWEASTHSVRMRSRETQTSSCWSMVVLSAFFVISSRSCSFMRLI